MPAPTNTITTSQMVTALDQEFVENFRGEYDRLEEILGLFPAEVAKAGVALYQYQITGSLNSQNAGEGEDIEASQYTLAKVPVGDMTPIKKKTIVTLEAIAKGGYENACIRIDKKFMSQLRALVLNNFFSFLANGTGVATGANLQSLLANVGAVLGNTLETNGDEGGEIVYFVNRSDAAAYLGNAAITTQTAFGLTYLENFLGVKNVILTNKVASGKVIATPIENIHVRGFDFDTLGEAGLVYEADSLGLIGIHHVPSYGNASAETYAVVGVNFLPEILDYIVIGEISGPQFAYTSYTDAECTNQLGAGKAKYISDDGSWTLVEVVENTPDGFTGNRYKVNGTSYADGDIYQLYTPGGEATGMYIKLGAAEVESEG